MMLDDAALTELQGALAAVELLVATRIEERRAIGPLTPGAPDATAEVHEVPDPADAEGLPPRQVFMGDGPLGHLVETHDLSAVEAVMVVAALAGEIDDRFHHYWAALGDRPGSAGLTTDVLRNLAGRSLAGRLEAAETLDQDGRLCRSGMLRVERAGVVGGPVEIDPDLARWLLGRPPRRPAATPELPIQRIDSVYALDDLVVPADVRRRLVEVVDRVHHRRQVLDGWGFRRHHDHVAGLLVLLHGPPGTGKSMAAAVLGKACDLPVHRVDLSAAVDKYVGETSKNLARIFDRLEVLGGLLFFDEADALFGKRTEVSDARDRWANQEVSYLLQRIEGFGGLTVMATNLLRNVDEAFLRRVDVQIELRPPGVGERRRLWRSVVPPDLPMADDVDWAELAERFALTGAAIRGAVVHAAFRAAADGGVVTAAHLHEGVRAEYEKAGQTLPASSGPTGAAGPR